MFVADVGLPNYFFHCSRFCFEYFAIGFYLPLPLGEGRREGCLWQGMYYILNSCQPFYHKGPVAKWLVKFLEQMVAAGQISACRLMPFD